MLFIIKGSRANWKSRIESSFWVKIGSFVETWMDLETIQSKSEREKQILYINAIYVESRKMV